MLKIFMLFGMFFSCYCLSEDIKNIKDCKLDEDNRVKLISLHTVDGNTPYLIFDNVIVSAFLDGSIYSGDIILSKCIHHSLIFALNYGAPYMKGCLITGVSVSAERKYQPNGFCFAERNIPESVWFGEDHTLIIIKNNNSVGEWRGKYIIYDSRGDAAQTFNKLPGTKNYKIYRLGLNK
ncbi:hypothetical protein DPT14_11120 [Salmonella enterica subsp. enterica serovar Telelkebir]|nr:hypothetical protein [Salmonella enterica subsp. enterica serovar Telelkebir]EBS2327326.1 hypothetical protein [Salmonella enterica subsp. enterica serovar Telelkebir]EBW5302816.1 hypothetical protein [Salmonella enterica subsp. enterica serovar Telelkebir]ECA8341290.1 hypothetical protein [Salmonella enterica subsp. enterica serovar Telelkebir]EGI6028462.1 hypothetical protein [Salmonella enterica subsp. enterica serovar Telelkebir]